MEYAVTEFSFKTDLREVPTFEYDEKRQRQIMTWQGCKFELVEPFWPDWELGRDSMFARFNFRVRLLESPRTAVTK